MRSIQLTMLLLLPLCLVTNAHAAVNAWSPVSQPEGLAVLGIAVSPVDPSIVYMRSFEGLHRSDDGGETWVLFSQLELQPIPDPLDADIVWLQDRRVVFRGDQRGAEITAVQGPLEGRAFNVQIAASSPRTIYANVELRQLWRSEDDGASWTQLILPDRPAIFANGFAVNPLPPYELLVAVEDGTILRSDDRGDTWQPTDTPIPRGPFGFLVFDSATAGHAYLSRGPHVYRSTDGGRTWEDFDHRDDPFRFLIFAPGSPGIAYAGTSQGRLLRSTDGALTWEPADAGYCGNSIFATASPETIYVGTGAGIFRQAHGDSSWSTSHAGLRRVQITDIASDPSRPGTLFGVSHSCVYRSFDGGESWTHLAQGSDPRARILLGRAVVVPTEPPTLFLATPIALFRSLDDGETWTASSLPDASGLHGPWFDPADPTVLWLGLEDDEYPYGPIFLRSRDNGETWDELTTFEGLADELAIDSRPPRSLYSGNTRSLDDGDTWTFLPLPLDFTLGNIRVDPTGPPGGPSPLYAVGELREQRGIVRSTDRGETWNFAPDDGTFTESESISLLEVDPAVTGTLWAWSEETGLRRSRDAGATWKPVIAGLPAVLAMPTSINPRPPRLEINPSTPARVLGAFQPIGRLEDATLYSAVIRDAVARFEVAPEADLEPGDTLTFRERSLGAPVSWRWDFGDGTSAEGPEVDHVYAEPGTYEVTLEIATAFDDRDIARRRLAVGDGGGPGAGRPCVDGPDVLCLQDGRFEVRVSWETSDGDRGTARPAPPRSPDSGLLWFFSAENWEMLVKVLDGCSSNGHFWVFAATASTVGFELRVTDLVAEETRVFRNAPGQVARAVADIRAFNTCSNEP